MWRKSSEYLLPFCLSLDSHSLKLSLFRFKSFLFPFFFHRQRLGRNRLFWFRRKTIIRVEFEISYIFVSGFLLLIDLFISGYLIWGLNDFVVLESFVFFFQIQIMSDGYYSSKKTDDICGQVCFRIVFITQLKIILLVFSYKVCLFNLNSWCSSEKSSSLILIFN